MNAASPELRDAAKALLDCKLSGADREFCERIAEDGFADDHSETEENEELGVIQRARVRNLVISHGGTL